MGRNKTRESQRAATRRWLAANPGYYQRRKSGEHERTLQSFLARQGGRCAICATSDPGMRGWHLDHKGGTQLFRGALCGRCNIALGYMKDDAARLRTAADYLDRHAALESLL